MRQLWQISEHSLRKQPLISSFHNIIMNPSFCCNGIWRVKGRPKPIHNCDFSIWKLICWLKNTYIISEMIRHNKVGLVFFSTHTLSQISTQKSLSSFHLLITFLVKWHIKQVCKWLVILKSCIFKKLCVWLIKEVNMKSKDWREKVNMQRKLSHSMGTSYERLPKILSA